jgi:integrase
LGNFREAWLTACRKASPGHRWFHSLRRSAARNVSLQGIPEKVIISIMGHKTRVMFDHYNIITEVGPARACEAAFRAVNTDNEADNLRLAG